MSKQNQPLFTALMFLLIVLSSPAAETNLLSTLSPKLRSFLAANPAALTALTNTLSSAFSGRSVQILYFYSQDPSRPRAIHYYPQIVGAPEVWLCIRENQNTLDELMTIVFESLNSKNEKRFLELMQQGASGTLSRTEFATRVLKLEFEPMKATRDVLRSLRLTKKQRSGSETYDDIIACPDELTDFLPFLTKTWTNRNPMREYEAAYDALRKKQGD